MRELLDRHLTMAETLVKKALTSEDPLVALGYIVRAQDRLKSAEMQAFVEAERVEVRDREEKSRG